MDGKLFQPTPPKMLLTMAIWSGLTKKARKRLELSFRFISHGQFGINTLKFLPEWNRNRTYRAVCGMFSGCLLFRPEKLRQVYFTTNSFAGFRIKVIGNQTKKCIRIAKPGRLHSKQRFRLRILTIRHRQSSS